MRISYHSKSSLWIHFFYVGRIFERCPELRPLLYSNVKNAIIFQIISTCLNKGIPGNGKEEWNKAKPHIISVVVTFLKVITLTIRGTVLENWQKSMVKFAKKTGKRTNWSTLTLLKKERRNKHHPFRLFQHSKIIQIFLTVLNNCSTIFHPIFEWTWINSQVEITLSFKDLVSNQYSSSGSAC